MKSEQSYSPAATMKWFVMFSIVYFTFALLITMVGLEKQQLPLVTLIVMTKNLFPQFLKLLIVLGLIGAVVAFWMRDYAFGPTISLAVMGMTATVLFQTAFTLTKTALPELIPFYADPFFANLDLSLHFGHDPWVLTERLAEFFPARLVEVLYMGVWGVPACLLPLVVCLFDKDRFRVQRTVIMYVAAWILIGNVFALAGMSAGPVYYDRVEGGERFAGLTATLLTNGLADSGIGYVQNGLWEIYSGQLNMIGSGISSFPSVHVAVATVLALYMVERSRLLGVIGVSYLAAILFLSVYTGYHYAIDGYFSIAVMTGLWAYLRRREKMKTAPPARKDTGNYSAAWRISDLSPDG